MNKSTIAKFGIAALSALSVTAPMRDGWAAILANWDFPASSGKPYSPFNAATGLDFSSWFISENQVINNHSTQTRAWTVPLIGLNTTGTASALLKVSNLSVSVRCDGTSKARLRVYNPDGSILHMGALTNCNSLGADANIGATPNLGPGRRHTANVEFQLAPHAAATTARVSVQSL